MVTRLITLSLFILNLLPAQGRSLPTFIYGPSATSYTLDGDTVTVKKLKLGKRILNDSYIASGNEKTFILICEETLLELQPESKILIDKSTSYLRIITGNVIIHQEGDITTFCYNVVVDNGAIGYIGTDKLKLSINYKENVLYDGTFYPKTDYVFVDKDCIKGFSRDGRYI